MLGTVSFFLDWGNSWIQLLGVCVECALEYSSWRKSMGLLSAPTSRTAPGNASHSSSWQLLGHFQKTGKKHSRIIFWSIWEQRVEGARALRLKTHGGLRETLASAPLFPGWFVFLKSKESRDLIKHTNLLFQRIPFHIKQYSSMLLWLCKLLSGGTSFDL